MTATAAYDEMRSQLRSSRKAAPPPWVPPQVRAFRGLMPVLAWDATLSHCGWAVVERIDTRVLVREKGTINTDTHLTGYLGTWEKARLLLAEIREVLDAYPLVAKVVEAPAVRGNRLESSLIAGMLIWLETVGPTGLGAAQISATHVSAVLCGNARLKSSDRKKAVKAACARYVPESEGRGWNEHERDALAVALTHLHDQNRTTNVLRLPNCT